MFSCCTNLRDPTKTVDITEEVPEITDITRTKRRTRTPTQTADIVQAQVDRFPKTPKQMTPTVVLSYANTPKQMTQTIVQIPEAKRQETVLHKRESQETVLTKAKKVLTAEERKERRERNGATRNDARKQEKARVAKFVNPPQVFVRVRPLNDHERKESHVLPGLKTKTQLAKELKSDEKVAMLEEGVLGGFEGVLGIEASNSEVYEATLADKIQMILNGGQVSMFCYGHTGTGKTHTSMGYGSQPGLFKLACADILKELEMINVGLAEEEKLFIQVRFTEVHVGNLFDLLADPKAPCSIMEDEAGEFRLRRIPEKMDEGWFVMGDQKYVIVEDLPTLLQMLEKGIQTRACGSSSVHDESSRSHAMMEMEIVTKAFAELREGVSQMEGKLVFGKLQGEKGNPDWPRRRVEKLKKELAQKRKEYRALLKKESRIGGTLTLADLAGADYDKRTYTESGGRLENRESAEINKELYSLKECMRIAVRHKPWRQTVLSKVLKKVLQPLSGRQSQSVVVANVTCAASQERFTLNTLRYAQAVSGYEEDKKAMGKVSRERDLKRQIRAIYQEHCPEKPMDEVEEILSKWAAKGKLTRLLPMVWAKYNTQKAKSPVAPKA